MSDVLKAVFECCGRPVPRGLRGWDQRVDAICDAYRGGTPEAQIVEVRLDTLVYDFDLTLERVVVAWGVSVTPSGARDSGRMAGFPDPNRGWGKQRAGAADRGHFLAHSAGGGMDINLFPQGRGLNRGWSPRGRVYRRMERYAAEHPGTFVFHQPEYTGESWIPSALVYGVLREDGDWWTERFENSDARRRPSAASPGGGATAAAAGGRRWTSAAKPGSAAGTAPRSSRSSSTRRRSRPPSARGRRRSR
jgi:hypothetical protein